jgi:hypothetical protein
MAEPMSKNDGHFQEDGVADGDGEVMRHRRPRHLDLLAVHQRSVWIDHVVREVRRTNP